MAYDSKVVDHFEKSSKEEAALDAENSSVGSGAVGT